MNQFTCLIYYVIYKWIIEGIYEIILFLLVPKEQMILLDNEKSKLIAKLEYVQIKHKFTTIVHSLQSGLVYDFPVNEHS